MDTIIKKTNIPLFVFDEKYRIYRHLVLQGLILMISIGVFFDAPDRLNFSMNRFWGWVSYFLFMNMLVYFNAYVLFPRYLVKNKILSYIVSVIVFIIFSIVVMMIIQSFFYDIAVINQEPSVVAIFLNIVASLLSLTLFLGGISAFLLFKHWMMSTYRINDLRATTSRSEISFLKSQINPHFLFNMLNNANILVEEDPEMASHILLKLDDLLRYQLNESDNSKVYLKDDIEFLKNFLELEKIRRDNFDYEIVTKGEIKDMQVAPMLFIPFVENAVKHNSFGDEESYVYLSFVLQDNRLTFTCENSISGNSNTSRKKDGGLGLSNIKRRLDLLYGKNYFLDQMKTDNKYTVNLQLYL